MTIGVYLALGLASAGVQNSTAREQLDRDMDPGSLKVAQRNAVTPGAASRAVRANLAHFGIEPFSPHDLRRTFTSGMSKLGIDRLSDPVGRNLSDT